MWKTKNTKLYMLYGYLYTILTVYILCVQFMNVQVSHMWLFATPWTILSMEFSRPEYWSGQRFPSPGDLPNPRTEHSLPHCRHILYHLVTNLPAVQETQFYPWEIRRRRDRLPTLVFLGFLCGSAGKESTCNAGGLGLITGLGRYPGEGKGYPHQYSGLENSMNYSPWVCKELDMTEPLSLSNCIYNTLKTFIPECL